MNRAQQFRNWQPSQVDSLREKFLALNASAGTVRRGRIPDATVERIREATPIEDIVSEYVRLKQSGQNFTGLCPFHSERTPSFHVRPAKQSYHCFGCGVGGDVFRFVMEMERCSFPKTVKRLAARAGIALVALISIEDAARSGREHNQRERMARALAEAESEALSEARENLRNLLSLRRKASTRLHEIRCGSPTRWQDEADWAWEALRFVSGELMRADACYCIAAFSAPAERYKLAIQPKRLAEAVNEALKRGFVSDQKGGRFEVAL